MRRHSILVHWAGRLAAVAVLAATFLLGQVAVAPPAAQAVVEDALVFSRTVHRSAAPFSVSDLHVRRPSGATVQLTNALAEPELGGGGYGYESPTPSPDGARIAAVKKEGSSSFAVVLDVSTGAARTVSSACGFPSATNVSDVAWLPDGRVLYHEPARGALFAVKADGTSCVRYATLLSGGDVAVSPDGTRLAYTVHDFSAGTSQVWVSGLSGQSGRAVTAPSSSASGPAWSPDSTRLAVMLRDGLSTRLGTLTVPPSGTVAPTVVSQIPSGARDPAWTSDGTGLLYGMSTSRFDPPGTPRGLFRWTAAGITQLTDRPDSSPRVATGRVAAVQAGRFVPLPTARLFDQVVGTAQRIVQIAGRAGVPASATAAVVNVEVFRPTVASYVRVTPAGQDANVATQQFRRGEAISNLVTVKLVDGRAQVKLAAGTARVLMDVAGYYGAGTGSMFSPVATQRTFDGTVGTAPVPVPITGRTGVPVGATAVAVNVEVFSPSADGYVRVTPFGKDPQVATQQYVKGQAISNLVITQIVNGKIQVKLNTGTARVLMDVAGYYSPLTGSAFTPLASGRTFDGQVGTSQTPVQITGQTGVPAGATAVAVNVEVFRPSAGGYDRVTPFGRDAQVATQQHAPGQAISNLVITQIVNGKIQVKLNTGTARVLMDVAGYYGGS